MIQRDNTVTISKAFAIMLMVLAHAGFYKYGSDLINLFHMPLFFFCSGYCFKEKYLDDFKTFFFRRIKGIYWPFVKYGLIFLLLHNVFYTLNIYNTEYGFRGSTSVIYDWKVMLKNAILISTSMNGSEQLLGGYWFLHTLFFASFISWCALYLSKQTKVNKWGRLSENLDRSQLLLRR